MRKYYRNIFLLTISIGISINASAQIKLPPKQSETKAPAKQTTTKQTYTDPSEGKHVLKLTTNADCYLKIDGEDKGIIRIDDVKKIYLDKGEYLIKAISTENKADVFNYEYTAKEINIQATYSIDLQSIINTRLTSENRSKQLEQERITSEQKEADEKITLAKQLEQATINREAKEADEKIVKERQAEQERISREEKTANETRMEANPLEMLLVAKQKQEEEKRTETPKQSTSATTIYTSKTGEQYDRWGNRIDVKETDTDAVFTFVEKTPEFPGGNNELIKFLQNNIKYPATERDNEIEGTVFIKFIVEKDGSVSNAEVLKSISPGLDKEALRVVNLFPNYSPGMQQGKPVRVSFTLPIKFALN